MQGDPQADVLAQEAEALEKIRDELVTEVDEESLIIEENEQRNLRQLSRDLRRVVDIQLVIKPKSGENPYFNLVDDFNKKTAQDNDNLQYLQQKEEQRLQKFLNDLKVGVKDQDPAYVCYEKNSKGRRTPKRSIMMENQAYEGDFVLRPQASINFNHGVRQSIISNDCSTRYLAN